MGARQRKRLLQRRRRAQAVARSTGRQRAVVTGAAFAAVGVAAAGLTVGPGTAAEPGPEKLAASATTGAELVHDLAAGEATKQPRELVAVGDSLFFTAEGDAEATADLWRLDPGSTPRKVALPGVTSPPEELVDVNGVLHFKARDNQNHQVWKLEGATARKLTNFAPFLPTEPYDGPSRLVAVGGTLFFTAHTTDLGRELWKSTGGPAAMVADINPGRASTGFGDLKAVGSDLFFADDHTAQVWAAPSVGTGARKVISLYVPLQVAEYSYIRDFTPVGETVFFSTRTSVDGDQLWKTDGSEAGTALVSGFVPSAGSSDINNLTAVGDRLYFTAGADRSSTAAIWQATPTAASKVADLGTVRTSLFGTSDGTLLFTKLVEGSEQLWRLSGSTPQQLTAFADGVEGVAGYSMVESGGDVYFHARDEVRGRELWLSNGTASGTRLVADIRDADESSFPGYLTDVAGTLHFVANDGVHGRELWRTTRGTPTPTPRPRPTVTPTPTSTPRPTVTPTPTSTPRPTVTPTLTPTPDRTVTAFKASAKKQQKVGKKLKVKVKAGAGERVTLKLTTTVKIKGKKGSLKLKTATVKTSAGQQKTVGLKASKSVTKKLLKALKQYRGAKSKKARDKRAVTATVTIRATDAAGNVKTKKVKIRLV